MKILTVFKLLLIAVSFGFVSIFLHDSWDGKHDAIATIGPCVGLLVYMLFCIDGKLITKSRVRSWIGISLLFSSVLLTIYLFTGDTEVQIDIVGHVWRVGVIMCLSFVEALVYFYLKDKKRLVSALMDFALIGIGVVLAWVKFLGK